MNIKKRVLFCQNPYKSKFRKLRRKINFAMPKAREGGTPQLRYQEGKSMGKRPARHVTEGPTDRLIDRSTDGGSDDWTEKKRCRVAWHATKEINGKTMPPPPV